MQRHNVREVAAGKWSALLQGFGLTERQLSGRHGPCPMCGGKDRFRFDDKEGRGTWFCSHCGAGDGVRLVMEVKDWDFKTAANEIEQIAGHVTAGPQQSSRSDAEKIASLNRAWSESKPLMDGDEAMRYLAGRGLCLDKLPSALRLHPGMVYRDGSEISGKFPVMLARVSDQLGNGLSLHRTYLNAGQKAPVEKPKKLMPGKPISGGAIRLFDAGEFLGVAEGIETALAARELFGVPTWACVSAHGIETFIPPDGVQRVTVFADNDANFTGQKAAMSLANRLSLAGIATDVQVPDSIGDWLDVLTGVQA